MLYYIFKYIQLEFFLLGPSLLLAILLNNRKNKQFIPLYTIKVFILASLALLSFNISYWGHINWQLVAAVLSKVDIIILFILAVRAFFHKKQDLLGLQFFRTYLFIFLISLGLFAFLTFLRLLNPELATTEKPMDLSFIVSFLRQDKPPFFNPWYAGIVLNYYYLGQFLASFIIYILNLTPWVGYNFIISLVAVWAFGVLLEFFIFHINIYKIKGRKQTIAYLISILGSSFILFAGNFYYLIRIIIDFLHSIHVNVFSNMPEFFYPDATRLIPYTINEYPAYSILLGDLHGHYLAIPFVYSFIFMFIYFLYYLKFISAKRRRTYIIIITILAVLAAFIAEVNSWDVITLGLFGFVVFVALSVVEFKLVLSWIRYLLLYTVLGLLVIFSLSFSFLHYFLPAADGLGIKFVLDIRYYPALWGQYMLLGLFLFFLSRVQRFKLRNFQDVWPIAGIIAGILLILLTQFFYIKDIFYKSNPDYFRANTVFKIYYTAWAIVGMSLFSLLLKFVSQIKKLQLLRYSLSVTFIMTVVFCTYFVIGITQRFSLIQLKSIFAETLLLDRNKKMNGLYKTSFFQDSEVEVIMRLYKKNFYNNIIVEPIDYKSYSDTAKFCIFSGSQCFIGWPLHNMQWYGGFSGMALWTDERKNNFHKDYIDIQRRVQLIEDFYYIRNFDLINYLQTHNMTTVHFLFYKKPPLVNYPEETALSVRQQLLQYDNIECHLIRMGYVLDLFCNLDK